MSKISLNTRQRIKLTEHEQSDPLPQEGVGCSVRPIFKDLFAEFIQTKTPAGRAHIARGEKKQRVPYRPSAKSGIHYPSRSSRTAPQIFPRIGIENAIKCATYEQEALLFAGRAIFHGTLVKSNQIYCYSKRIYVSSLSKTVNNILKHINILIFSVLISCCRYKRFIMLFRIRVQVSFLLS